MKSAVWYACVVGLLFVSPVAFGELWTTGDWDGLGGAAGGWGSSAVVALADGTTTHDYGLGYGWHRTYTTLPDFFTWAYYVYAWAECGLFLWSNESCAAQAQAYGSASCAYEGDTQDAYVYLQQAGEGGTYVFLSDYDSISGVYLQDTNWFDADEGVYAEHSAFCQAAVQEGRDDGAYAHAHAEGWTSMWAPP